jgi:hypothetical protein
MKCYLVEAYSPDLKFEDDTIVIALTPLASYGLDKASIKYSILEDYYDEAEFIKEEQAYFEDQLAWFDKFDNFLFEIFPGAKIKNVKLATTYYFYIKPMVDSLILRCKVINIFINRIKPDSIIYISPDWKEDVISSAEFPLLFRKGQSLFSRLIPIFCNKYEIDFKRIILKEVLESNNVDSGYKSFTNRIKNKLKRNEYIRNLWYFYQTVSISCMFHKLFDASRWNLLFLKRNNYIVKIMKDAQSKGHQVFYKRGNNIIKQSSIYHKVTENISPDKTPRLEKDVNNFGLNSETDITKWINGYCGIDVSAIILPRLLYVVNEFCPRFISLVNKYISFYNAHQIDFVFTNHRVSMDEYAAIAAARYSKKTKSACLQHGDEAFVLKTWDFSEYSPYHIYFTTNYEREACIKQRIHLGNFDTKVFQYPNRFEELPKVNNLKRKQNSQAHRKTLVYVPTIYQWDNALWIETRVPDTWYFSWHKKLIKFFSSRDDFNFIWKGIPAFNETYDPIPNIIDDRKYKNIKYATEPFVKWIKKADLVLLDYPSTALYEAAVSRLPVMCLVFAPFNIVRESALKLFGKSLQPFSNFTEGIAKTDCFLNSDLNEFIVPVPYSKTSVVETLDYSKATDVI